MVRNRRVLEPRDGEERRITIKHWSLRVLTKGKGKGRVQEPRDSEKRERQEAHWFRHSEDRKGGCRGTNSPGMVRSWRGWGNSRT